MGAPRASTQRLRRLLPNHITNTVFSRTDNMMRMPALVGDAEGVYRIRIVGNSGSGKSTTAQNVGALLDLPVIHLDEIHWCPGWKERPNDDMKRITYEKMNEHTRGWVMEGNYLSVLGDSDSFSMATDVIWLDPPFLLYFPRLLSRTFRRLFVGSGPPCAPGCDEDWREVFLSRNSIILWCITHHSSVRRRYERMCEPVERGGKWRRLGGWGGDFRRWWTDLERIAKSR